VVYPVVQPRPTLAYSMLWRPNGRGLQSTPLKRSKDPLEYHGVLLALLYEQHTQDKKSQQHHAHKSQQELTTQLNEFTTQLEL
jgi:hypothetical protein